MIYLDNAATSMPLPCAIDAAAAAMTADFGNPSSIHGMGRNALALLDKSRAETAAFLGCTPGCLIFTSSATEAANAAISCALEKNRRVGRHIITTQIEHAATMQPLAWAKQQGWEITYIAPRFDGVVKANDILEALREDTALVALQAVNSETGARTEWEDVADTLKTRQAMLYLDMVQGLWGHESEDLSGVDFAAISAHKIGGIKGAGALYIANPRKYLPFIRGGGQETGMRSGTEAMPAIAAFGAACEYRRQHRAEDSAQLAMLHFTATASILGSELPMYIHSPQDSAHHIINISFDKGRSEVYIRALEEKEIYISGGSACTKGKRSHVLQAVKMDAKYIDSALRISVVPENTVEEIELLISELEEAYKLF